MVNIEVLQKAVKGDPESITKVVDKYTPLIHKFVEKYSWMSQSHSKEDLVQEGVLGIIKAIDTFDFKRNTSFMTWVYPQVHGAVQSFARKEMRQWSKDIANWEIDISEFAAPTECESKNSVISSESALRIQDLISNCAGAPTSKRAQVVCARFGLMGRTALRQGEVAKEFNMSKQAVNSHISKFSEKVRKKYPDLFEFVLGG